MKALHIRRGMTVLELAVVVVILLIVGIAIIAMTGPRRRTGHNPSMKDSTQIRGIWQAIALHSNTNQGVFPMPSGFPSANGNAGAAHTPDETLNTTGNIVSLMIWCGYFSPELCVSPAEINPNIKIASIYDYDIRKDAPTGTCAWDPNFNADFTDGKIGNLSYALLKPFGARLHDWRSDSMSSTTAIVGNRGPEISSASFNSSGALSTVMANPTSNTFLIHGSRTAWEGNVAYADGHVNYETTVAPEQLVYSLSSGKPARDVLFMDESDDPSGRNAMLGIYVKAGAAEVDWKAIWD